MKTLKQYDAPQNMELLTSVQLANELGCSERTISSLRKKYSLPYYRFGRSIRYDKLAVLKVLDSGNG